MVDRVEEWRSISGFEGYYEVSNFGNVRSCDRQLSDGRTRKSKPMAQSISKSGHRKVRLCRGNVHHFKLVHRLVAEAFIGPCPDGLQCAHNNGDPSCNHDWNLRWDTVAGNAADRILHGTQLIGPKNHLSKLTDDDVRKLWTLHRSGMTGRDIAKFLGCTPANVSSIINRKTWGHLQCQ